MGFFCLYACVQRATCAGSLPTERKKKFRPSALISCWSFCTYVGSPPRKSPFPCESTVLNSDQSFFSPVHDLSSGCCFIRYVGTNHPMCPMTPFEPRLRSVPL